MITRLVHLTRREYDRRAVESAELLRNADAGARHLEVDIYECDVRPLGARQLQGFARRVRWPEHGKPSVLEYRSGTVGDDCLIFDDQYDHTNTSNKRRRGFLRGGASENYRSSV